MVVARTDNGGSATARFSTIPGTLLGSPGNGTMADNSQRGHKDHAFFTSASCSRLMPHPEQTSVWNPRRRQSDALEVYLLGIVDFDSAMWLQERLHREIAEREDGLGTLLICEHPPTVTTGREGTMLDLLADPREFESQQIEIRRVDRGGGTILHGPGQVAAYPILPVDRRTRRTDAHVRQPPPISEYRSRKPEGPRSAVPNSSALTDVGVRPTELNRRLLDFVKKCMAAVCDMASELKVNATTTDDCMGAECRCGQFAWAGAAIRDGVSSHGLFVNVSPDMLPFRLVRSARSVGSMSMQRMSPVPMAKVRESLMRNLADQFGYEDVHLYTRHPLLTRTTRKVVEYA